jgi:hypothetical protein
MSEVALRFPETSGEHFGNFSVPGQLVTNEIVIITHFQKIQFHDCKRLSYFENSRKVPLGKFPLEKTPPENISDNFIKFQKFFPTRVYREMQGKEK